MRFHGRGLLLRQFPSRVRAGNRFLDDDTGARGLRPSRAVNISLRLSAGTISTDLLPGGFPVTGLRNLTQTLKLFERPTDNVNRDFDDLRSAGYWAHHHSCVCTISLRVPSRRDDTAKTKSSIDVMIVEDNGNAPTVKP